MGDFNSEINEDAMMDFCVIYNFKSLINYPTCFKNPENPSCINLMLTNKPMSFQNASVTETGLSHFDKLTVTIMKMNFSKQGATYCIIEAIKHPMMNTSEMYVFNKRALNNIACSE